MWKIILLLAKLAFFSAGSIGVVATFILAGSRHMNDFLVLSIMVSFAIVVVSLLVIVVAKVFVSGREREMEGSAGIFQSSGKE